MRCELIHSDYHALSNIECDTLISDPPYSERTHAGHDQCEHRTNDGAQRRALSYAAWDEIDVNVFVDYWAPRTRGWFVVMCDHYQVAWYEARLNHHGRYVFSPVQFVWTGSRVRLQGDGPAQWSTSIVVARPRTREFSKWGALPGAYVFKAGARDGHIGGKPLGLMRALVRDYSRPGALICDPCAGYGTTLDAARQEGRQAIGTEIDEATYAQAMKRLGKPFTPQLFGGVANDNGRGW